MVNTRHDGGGVESAHNQAANAEGKGQQGLDAADDAVFHCGEDGADDGVGQVAGGKNADQGRDKEVEHGGDHLMEALFNEAHDPHGDDHRDDAALVAHQIYLVETEPDALRPQDALRCHGPGVLQVRVNHQHADDRPEIGISAEGLRGAVRDQDGQEHIRSVGEEIGEHIDGAGGVDVQKAVVDHEVQGLHDAHQEAGGHNGGDDGDEDIPQAFDGPLEEGLLCGGGGLHLFLGGGRQTGDFQELVVDLVDGAGAQNQLELSVGAENALYTVHILQGLHVDLSVVHRHQPQPGGAVGRADQVLPPAEEAENLPGAFCVIHCHSRFLPCCELVTLF